MRTRARSSLSRNFIVAFCVIGCAALGVGPANAASKNVQFRGTWHLSNGGIFHVTTENLTTGVCALSAVGEFSTSKCLVTGHHYALTVVQNGTSYRSYNSGTIVGNKLTGKFHDTNGTIETYTGVRT
jgi:hypothetical protein